MGNFGLELEPGIRHFEGNVSLGGRGLKFYQLPRVTGIDVLKLAMPFVRGVYIVVG